MTRIRSVRLFFSLLVAGLLAVLSLGSTTGEAPNGVTYTKDVAPILQKNCMVCHRPGEIAPMSLLTYKEVRPWAKSIREVVAERRMPPWLADPHFSEFANDRRLSPKEVATIMAWVDGGAKEGDPKALPPNPKFEEGWVIGKPDVVLSMTEEVTVPADGVVPYRYFAVPTNFKEDHYVQAAEVRIGNRSVVHHVIATVLEPGGGPLPPAGEIGRPVGEGEGGTSRRIPTSGLVGTAPGMPPMILAPGQAKLVKAGSVLSFQMHYTPNGQAAKDRTSVGLIFAKGPVEKRVLTAGAFGRNLAIPPGDPSYEVKSDFTFREDSHVVSFMPHMHVRGKDFEYKLVYPDGTSKVVLSVPRYDFNWQLEYVLKEPLAAPKGSRMECVAHFDNSTKNKFNPDPTKLVRWGPQTWEEMMIGWFDYTLDGQHLRSQAASK